MIIREPYKILIVDDKIDISEIIQDHLEEIYGEKKFIIETSDNPNDALELLRTKDYNILITDLKMPQMSGEALLLETLSLKKGIQVIVLSGLETYVTALNCFLDGASSFVTKPFKEEKLKEAVDLCLHKIEFWRDFMKKIKKINF